MFSVQLVAAAEVFEPDLSESVFEQILICLFGDRLGGNPIGITRAHKDREIVQGCEWSAMQDIRKVSGMPSGYGEVESPAPKPAIMSSRVCMKLK